GSDLIDGGAGSDACIGGPGDDRYRACDRCAASTAASRIAFSRTESGDGVYVMSSDGSRERRVSHKVSPPREAHDYEPAWSPDGRKIAFDGGGYDSNLYVVGASGRGLDKIVDQGDGYASFTPDWSSDGRRIAFETEDLGDETFDVYSVSSGGGEVDALTSSEAGRFHPRHSPDGELIAVEGNTDEYHKRVYLIPPSGDGEVELMPGHIAYAPSWSPSSQWVAIAASPEPATRFDAHTEVFLVHRSGHGATQLTSDGGAKSTPRWSPDGTRVLFVRDDSGNRDLWIVDADGGAQRRVTSLPGDETAPQWSPDGERIVFVRAGGRSTDLFSIGADGNGLRRLTASEGFETAPQWQPKSCS
ncbi:MAG: DPP IV N-terminal domain-containing protein, partial [Actinomycetota bacterium]|nr:DPP IV N-terminal domain-containing protein [Actinomycetota bacterium]